MSTLKAFLLPALYGQWTPLPDIEHEEEAPLVEAVLRYHIEQYPDPATSQSQIDRDRIDEVDSRHLLMSRTI